MTDKLEVKNRPFRNENGKMIRSTCSMEKQQDGGYRISCRWEKYENDEQEPKKITN